MPKKRILILGGGFAGIQSARILESRFMRNFDIDITLVSEDNFFLFTPMLPQIASGTLEPRHIIIPIRTLCTKIKFFESKINTIVCPRAAARQRQEQDEPEKADNARCFHRFSSANRLSNKASAA